MNKGGEYALDNRCCVDAFVGRGLGQFVHIGWVHPSFVNRGFDRGSYSCHSGPPGVEGVRRDMARLRAVIPAKAGIQASNQK